MVQRRAREVKLRGRWWSGRLSQADSAPVVVLQGVRQCGKSTLARQITRRRHPATYITLDEPGVREVEQVRLGAGGRQDVGHVSGRCERHLETVYVRLRGVGLRGVGHTLGHTLGHVGRAPRHPGLPRRPALRPACGGAAGALSAPDVAVALGAGVGVATFCISSADMPCMPDMPLSVARASAAPSASAIEAATTAITSGASVWRLIRVVFICGPPCRSLSQNAPR